MSVSMFSACGSKWTWFYLEIVVVRELVDEATDTEDVRFLGSLGGGDAVEILQARGSYGFVARSRHRSIASWGLGIRRRLALGRHHNGQVGERVRESGHKSACVWARGTL